MTQWNGIPDTRFINIQLCIASFGGVFFMIGSWIWCCGVGHTFRIAPIRLFNRLIIFCVHDQPSACALRAAYPTLLLLLVSVVVAFRNIVITRIYSNFRCHILFETAKICCRCRCRAQSTKNKCYTSIRSALQAPASPKRQSFCQLNLAYNIASVVKMKSLKQTSDY